jgi:cellulose synthase/poly-beta-1,6-N-acetylglucosamine synthase-like glycosyltransferase
LAGRERVQAAIYGALFVVLAGSGILFLSQYGADVRFWESFTFGYLLLLVVYTWWLFALLLAHDLRPRRYPQYDGEKIAVIIPCFNESPELVEESIRTVLAAEGEKQVIVVDDGSTNGVPPHLVRLADETGITVMFFGQNRGKREALYLAVLRLLDDDVQFVVTIDSDTLLEPDALVRVVEPLKLENVGASTGNVLLLNERHVAGAGLLLTVILPSWIVLMLVRYVFVPLRARDKVLGLFSTCSSTRPASTGSMSGRSSR